MNVYDFDKTIYDGDSTADFIGYAFLHRPKSLLNLPRLCLFGILYGIRVVPKLTFKQHMYHMFVYIDDIDDLVSDFIETHQHKIKDWYLEQQKEDDLVISASPEFVIVPFCKKIGIHHAMASKVDRHTGKYDGLNCHGEEKVRRFYEAYPENEIDEFYSDSRTDDPLAKIAKSAFLVKGNRIMKW